MISFTLKELSHWYTNPFIIAHIEVLISRQIDFSSDLIKLSLFTLGQYSQTKWD